MLPLEPRLCCVLTHSWSLNVTEGTSWNATRYAADEQRAWIPFPCSFTNAIGYSLHRQTALTLQICPLVRSAQQCQNMHLEDASPLKKGAGILSLDFLWRCFIHSSLKCTVNCNHEQNAI